MFIRLSTPPEGLFAEDQAPTRKVLGELSKVRLLAAPASFDNIMLDHVARTFVQVIFTLVMEQTRTAIDTVVPKDLSIR